MKKMTFVLACAATCALFAEVTPIGPKSTFEGITAGTKITEEREKDAEGVEGYYWQASGEADASVVKASGTDDITTADGGNYLALSTEGDTLWRNVKPTSTEESQEIGANGLFVDTMVQFTATEGQEDQDLGEDAKLGIWLNTEDGVNTLCVKGMKIDGDSLDGNTPSVYKMSGVDIEPGKWYHLQVKAISNVAVDGMIGGFQIWVDDTELVADQVAFDEAALETLEDPDYCSSEVLALIKAKKIIPSLQGAVSTLTSVGFKGTGAVDDLYFYDGEEPPAPASVDFTLSWPTDATAVKYTIGTGEEVTLTAEQLADGSLKIEPMPGTAITMKVTNANGVEKTLNATAGTEEGQTNSLAPAEDTWSKVTPTVTIENATATIKVGEAAYVAETAYEEGAVITVADVAAIDGYKDAAATVSINGAEAIAFPVDGVTIGADTTSIAITVTATQMDTYTVTAAAELNANVETVTATPASFREDAESFVTTLTATFAEGYELDYFTVDGDQIEGNTVTVTKSITINAVAKQMVVPVTGVTIDNKPTAAMKVGDEITLTATVAPENATDKTVAWSVTGAAVTVVDGKVTAVAVGEATVTATAGEKSDSVTITVEAAGKDYPEYIGDDPAKQAKYEAWAKEYGADTTSAYEEAYLLNVAPADAEAEAAAFKIVSITIDAEGNVTVVPPSKNSKDADFNGTVEVKGAATVDGEYTLDVDAPTARFFKAFLK